VGAHQATRSRMKKGDEGALIQRRRSQRGAEYRMNGILGGVRTTAILQSDVGRPSRKKNRQRQPVDPRASSGPARWPTSGIGRTGRSACTATPSTRATRIAGAGSVGTQGVRAHAVPHRGGQRPARRSRCGAASRSSSTARSTTSARSPRPATANRNLSGNRGRQRRPVVAHHRGGD
jgi:hypothetical protein